ncbi:MAG: GTP pyrophosphokinase family protein, partial [Desulfitobacterium sp.]|nr:GTP pyrophosphokinase family protein [Desulfitobacterium sp.]
RLKKPSSIFGKLRRRGLPLSIDSIIENIHDVAGVRVICPFINDIYAITEMLCKQDDIFLLNKEDYIKDPKPNGYRSMHLVVEVPVFFSNNKQHVKVEIQIRTIAMDFWASLEHQIHYKKDLNAPENLIQELKECADIIAETDERMQVLQKRLAKLNKAK